MYNVEQVARKVLTLDQLNLQISTELGDPQLPHNFPEGNMLVKQAWIRVIKALITRDQL